MKTVLKLAAATALGAGILAASASSASAYIVCNRDGDCWHVRDHYEYRPEFGLVVHDDNWRWHHADRYRWREHHGRGYWRSGVWVTF
ncbi:MAG TPA: hypothetical protein VMS78_07460 [Rhizomicrobium sp.]|nr:hypothetical protein [Rhizomicrobium sp.]